MLHAMVLVFTACLILLVLCGSAYVTSFAVFGLRERHSHASLTAGARFAAFIPAHNESAGIRDTIRSIQRANYPEDWIRIVVIADNCTDDTAEQARACGVEPWIRNDLQNRGKGQALQWAFAKLNFAFDLIAIVDADTLVDPGFFTAMDSAYAAYLHAEHPEVVLQSRSIFVDDSASSWYERFTVATKAAENSLSLRPRTALGLANLIHNGFCISRAALAKVPFEASSIVEDAEYAITLALNNVPVAHVDEARVMSRMTRRMKDAATQRLRWASGTLSLLTHSLPTLVRAAIRQRTWKLAEMAVMLVLTSRLILVYATAVSLLLLFYLRSSSGFDILALALAASLFLQSIYLYLICRKADSTPVPFKTIAFMPLYLGYLGAMQLGAVLGLRKKQWNRAIR